MEDSFHKTDMFFVKINRYSFNSFTSGNNEVSHQFNISFGRSYFTLLNKTLGDTLQVAEVRSLRNEKELAAIFPFTDAQNVKNNWASKIRHHSVRWADLLETRNDVAIMDFSSVSPHFKGQAAGCFRAVADTLGLNGYGYGITEVQWLRQLMLWLRKGWKKITPAPDDLSSLYFEISKILKHNQDPGSVLKKGQELIWQYEPIYEKPKWNIVLEQSVYLAYQFRTNILSDV